MAARNKPYESFGPYILFKKLEADALGDLWRAGRIESGQLGPVVALRRITGGNRPAIAANAETVAALLPQLSGHSFAREQSVGVIDGVPYLAHTYSGGRSLRHIIDRGRGGNGVPANPLPLDQAIVIAEKVALSLATTAELRDGGGTRLSHGALVPQFIWISDDGEIRVAGQQLGTGLIASMSDPKVAADIGRYFCPESRSGTQPKTADVYSLGAILFLLVTGQEPPDASTASAFGAAVRAAKTLTGAPVPDDIRVILDKSFNLDPSMRYASIAEMKQAVSALAHGGKYSASTFNLAFYLSNLLKKEMESEAVDREKESKVNVAPYLETPKSSGPAPRVEPTPVPAMFLAAEEPKAKSKLPLAIAAVAVIAIAGAAGVMMMKNKNAAPAAQVTAAKVVPAAAPAPRVISEPILASGSTTTAPATSTAAAADPEAQKKQFEEAVARKMQQEMLKLQADFLAELKKKEAKNAPVAIAPAPAQQQEERAPSAAQLDQQRRETATPQRQEQVAEQAPAPVVTPAQTPASAPQQTAPAPAPAQVSAVREGDVVDVQELDQIPRPVKPIAPTYPLLARQQRIAARIMLTALVNEQGNVTDVRVLQGDARFGLNDAAIRAMRATKFSTPMKDGKRVKTWFPQAIEFRP